MLVHAMTIYLWFTLAGKADETNRLVQILNRQL